MILRRLALAALAALLPLGAAAEPTASEKPVIEKKDDLPDLALLAHLGGR